MAPRIKEGCPGEAVQKGDDGWVEMRVREGLLISRESRGDGGKKEKQRRGDTVLDP